MSRQDQDERREAVKKVLHETALAVTLAVETLKNFQSDKWFAKLKDAHYLSNFMSWFNKKTMNEQDFNHEAEIIEGDAETATFNDTRRFDGDGERVREDAKGANVKSPEMIRLENDLKDERARRESAEAKLIGVQAKFEELKTQMERETSEMRQRLMKTLEDRAKQGQFNFLTTLLPVLDNLNLGIKASETDLSFDHLLVGVKGTARSFEQALTNVGVEPIAAVGQDFNPELHEAVEMIETNLEHDGKIVGEFSRGYKFGDKLLRPSRVQVGKSMSKSVGE